MNFAVKYSRLCCLMLALLALAAPLCAAPSEALAGKSVPVTNKLRWRGGAIDLAISSSLLRQSPNIKYESDVAGAIRRSIETWERAGGFRISGAQSDKQSISAAGLKGDGISLITTAATTENVLLFAGGVADSAAATRVFFDKRGFITEADIVLNPYVQFSTDGTIGTYDLQSTLTHELGHLLGLEDLDVIGATMYGKYGRNGTYGLPNFAPRTLAQVDISALRRIYGGLDSSCCSAVSGKLLFTDTTERSMQIWAEEKETGRVVAASRSSQDGAFNLQGLTRGSLRLYAQDDVAAADSSAVIVGDVFAEPGGQAPITRLLTANAAPFRLSFVGLNAQLSDTPVTTAAGRVITIYLGGTGIDPKTIVPGFTTSYISVVPDTVRSLDYGPGVSVISFDVRIDEQAPAGEYTIRATDERGEERYLVGALSVTEAPVPLSEFANLAY